MTENQKRFCDEYIIDMNGVRAYKAAYPNVKRYSAAAVNASQLLKKTNVRAYIDKRLQELQNERTASAQEVLEYLTSVLRGETRAAVVVVEGTGKGESEAREMSKAPDEKERLKAAELLGKRYALFTDKVTAEVVALVYEGENELED